MRCHVNLAMTQFTAYSLFRNGCEVKIRTIFFTIDYAPGSSGCKKEDGDDGKMCQGFPLYQCQDDVCVCAAEECQHGMKTLSSKLKTGDNYFENNAVTPV